MEDPVPYKLEPADDWAAGEREADADIAAGRIERFATAEEAIESLRAGRMLGWWHVLNDAHEPVAVSDIHVWGEWWQKIENRRVARTNWDDVTVSTIFLGSDHNWYAGNPPLWFETMIFGLTGPSHDHWQRRYTTWAQAQAGHQHAVAFARRYQRRYQQEASTALRSDP